MVLSEISRVSIFLRRSQSMPHWIYPPSKRIMRYYEASRIDDERLISTLLAGEHTAPASNWINILSAKSSCTMSTNVETDAFWARRRMVCDASLNFFICMAYDLWTLCSRYLQRKRVYGLLQRLSLSWSFRCSLPFSGLRELHFNIAIAHSVKRQLLASRIAHMLHIARMVFFGCRNWLHI